MTRALILTAKSTETKAVKLQLLGPKSSARTARGNRYNIWSLRAVDSWDREVDEIEIALYETGRGQSAALINTGPLVEAFNPDLVVYIGCAGGEPDETGIGDVFVATDVWNYESASVTEGIEIKRKGHPICPDRVLIDEARSISEFNRWRHRIPGGAKNDVEVLFGPIASGEKIIKHTEAAVWKSIKSTLSDEIIACETEGHGFLASLSQLKTFGIMIRGISDNLIGKDADGKTHDDNNQTEASCHAAAFACQLISEIDSNLLRETRAGVIGRRRPIDVGKTNIDTGADPDVLSRSSKADSALGGTTAAAQQSADKSIPVSVSTSTTKRSISRNNDQRTWPQGLISVYYGTVRPHASDIIAHGIDLSKCRPYNDFGRGFYTTRLFKQAVMFANEKFRILKKNHKNNDRTNIDPECAAVVEFVIALDALRKMESCSFVQATPDYEEFVSHCRAGAMDITDRGNFMMWFMVLYQEYQVWWSAGRNRLASIRLEDCHSFNLKGSFSATRCYRDCLKYILDDTTYKRVCENPRRPDFLAKDRLPTPPLRYAQLDTR